MNSIGDVVMIHIDSKPSVYARVESIEADAKPRWFQVKLLFLSIPPQEVTWILKREYIEGSPFTMKDIPIQIVTLEPPGGRKPQKPGKSSAQVAEVISINRLREKRISSKPDD